MMMENERVPPNERLNQHEFNLDLKEQKKLHIEGEEKVAKVRVQDSELHSGQCTELSCNSVRTFCLSALNH